MDLSNDMAPEAEYSGRNRQSPYSNTLFMLLLVAMSFTISTYLVSSPSNSFNLLKSMPSVNVSEGSVLADTSFHPLPANPRNDIGGRITKKVLVLEYNPLVNGGTQKLTEAKGWGNPTNMENEFISEMRVVSQGVVDFQIHDHVWLDAIPRKLDGFQYTVQGYLTCLYNNATCHSPDAVDYRNILTSYRDSSNRDVCTLLNQGVIDELWLWGGPFFGYKENTYAGTGSIWIEGVQVTNTTCSKPMHIFGFNYERSLENMTDDMGHLTEYVMQHVNNGVWQTGYDAPVAPTQPVTAFDKFTARGYEVGIPTGCGNSHGHLNTPTFPGRPSYSWDSTNSKQSNCEDWLKYPALTGQTTALSCSTWGSCAGTPNQERNWRRYWFYHIPKYSGSTGGKWNNWWWYVLDYKQALANVAPPAPDFILPHSCNDVCLRNDQCQAIDPAYTCSTDALWSATPLGNWPGTGNVLVFSESIYGGKLTQKMIRGDTIYTRLIPVTNNVPNWGMASTWTNTPLSNWPGSGAIQGLSEAVYGGNLTQKFMRGTNIHVRLVPLVNGSPSWGAAGAWTTTPQSNWPGSGDIQGFSETVYANKLNQTLVRGTEVFARTIPLVNNVPSWGSASAWTSTPLSSWPGTGTVDSYNETTYVSGGVLSLVQKIIRGDSIYVRLIPIQNNAPIMTAGRCRLASNPTSVSCTQ